MWAQQGLTSTAPALLLVPTPRFRVRCVQWPPGNALGSFRMLKGRETTTGAEGSPWSVDPHRHPSPPSRLPPFQPPCPFSPGLTESRRGPLRHHTRLNSPEGQDSPEMPPVCPLRKTSGCGELRGEDSQEEERLCFSMVRSTSLAHHVIHMSLRSFLAADSATWLLL